MLLLASWHQDGELPYNGNGMRMKPVQWPQEERAQKYSLSISWEAFWLAEQN